MKTLIASKHPFVVSASHKSERPPVHEVMLTYVEKQSHEMHERYHLLFEVDPPVHETMFTHDTPYL